MRLNRVPKKAMKNINPGRITPSLNGITTKIGVIHFLRISICSRALFANRSMLFEHKLIIINTKIKAYKTTRPMLSGFSLNLLFRNTPTTIIRTVSWIRKKNTAIDAISTKLNILRILTQLHMAQILFYFLAKCLQIGIRKANKKAHKEQTKTGKKLAWKLYSRMNS
jgi:hypothetical protein